jgi:hypothetical protein
VRVSVGVGAGNKDAMLAWLNMQMQKQMALLPTGIVTPENIYNTAIEEAKLQGHSNPEKFWSNPADKPPAPPQPPPEVVKAQMQIQADMQKNQAQMQADQQKAQMDAQIAAQKQQQDMELAREKAQQDAMLEKYKADLQAQTTLQVEQMKLGGAIEIKQAELQTSREIKGAEIQSTREMAQFEAENKPEDDGKELLAQVAKAIEQLAKPRELVRDQSGRAIGVRSVG